MILLKKKIAPQSFVNQNKVYRNLFLVVNNSIIHIRYTKNFLSIFRSTIREINNTTARYRCDAFPLACSFRDMHQF